jgi:putative two-component system response regulator
MALGKCELNLIEEVSKMREQDVDRVLIVDDEIYIRDILSRMMTSAGYNCVTSANGNEALDKLSKGSFSLVLLDNKMPGLSGEEVLSEVTSRYPETAVIMVTAVTDVSTVIRMMKAGAYDYVVKPVDLEMLLISVNRAMDKRSLVVENRNYRDNLEDKVKDQVAQIRNNMLSSVTSIIFTLESEDIYTSGHSQRVSAVAVAIAREIGLGNELVEYIRTASLVHDIGKIITGDIIPKSGDRANNERYQVTSHSLIGEKFLRPMMADESIPQMIRYHHE